MVETKLDLDLEVFEKLSKEQQPSVLWIGCADNSVVYNEINGVQPGEVFVHRNIANMVVHTDMNMLSVLDYAVNALKVKHVIVCGHYGCGGVNAAMSNQSIGLTDNWIRHIRDVYRLHKNQLDQIDNEKERFDRFVELNVKEQVFDLAKTSIVQGAWNNGEDLQIHGCVYRLDSGLIKDLGVNFKNDSKLDSVFQLNF